MEEGFKVPEFLAKPPKPEENPPESTSATKTEVPYKIPKWSGPTAQQTYSFEVLKNGAIVDLVRNLQERPYWMFGRLPVDSGVDIQSLHPTTSRFHAVLQYKVAEEDEYEKVIEGGWFIFDLGKSTCLVTPGRSH